MRQIIPQPRTFDKSPLAKKPCAILPKAIKYGTMIAMSCAKYVTVLENITIVLVRPEGQANIGAICRAMKAMGVHRLRIVDMQSPEDLTAIRTWSLSAFDIYENAQHFATLPQALADMTLVVATSRRLGKIVNF